MNIINLTPHDIKVRTEQGDRVFPATGEVVRVDATLEEIGLIDGIPVSKQTFGGVVGLPKPTPDTVFIVSALVISALKAAGIERDDVVAPDTNPGRAFRDEKGLIEAVPGFVK